MRFDRFPLFPRELIAGMVGNGNGPGGLFFLNGSPAARVAFSSGMEDWACEGSRVSFSLRGVEK